MAAKKNKKNSTTGNVCKHETGTKRFRWVFFLLCAVGAIVIFTSMKTMFWKRPYWEEVRKQFVKANIVDKAKRGNIYDCNNRLLVGSVPEYRLCIDFTVIDKDSLQRVKAQKWRDSAFVADLDSIAIGLHQIFPDYTEKYFHDRLKDGFDKKKNGWSILPKHLATFIEYNECKKLPLLRESSFKGGFHGDEIMTRKKPYGSLASRTLGSLRTVNVDENGKEISDSVLTEYRKKNMRIKYTTESWAKNGIELMCDTILRGKDGIKHNTKVRNAHVDFSDKAAINGHDIMTTIDVDIQDIAEKALVAQLKSLDAEMGVVIVMEAKTGDVKAIVNMGQDDSGNYSEILNYSISECMEPGSTFKTASLMAALEDGKCDTSTVYNTGNGRHMFSNRWMKDASWSTSGGYGSITVKKIIEKSSNVGVSLMIDGAYHNNPQAYIDALKREGAGIPLDLPLAGAKNPVMKTDPKNKKEWWATTLPWMSIGYESLLPPISTCAFYNGIANNGKLLKPRFVKAEMEDGKIVREFPIEVLREKMCSEQTLQKVRGVLENVVSAPRGTGKKARCQFKVAGKTGTAQIAAPGKGYHAGVMRYFVSFCGFFPYENPQYTCFVGIRKYGLPASGGGHCAPVFAQVAQAMMTRGMNHRIPIEVRDSNAVLTPTVKTGNTKETQQVLNELHIANSTVDTSRNNRNNSEVAWCKPDATSGNVKLVCTHTSEGKMPDVTGMGARDAVYALQKAGIKVKIKGAGKVVSQSVSPGTDIKKGTTVNLTLGV